MSDESKIIRPTPERIAHAGDHAAYEVYEDDQGKILHVLRMTDSPIDRLAFGAKPKITGEQYHAALRFYADAYGAGLMSSGVIDPAKERVDGGQYKNISDVRIAAQVRYEHAIKALSHEHFHILQSIVVQETPFGDYAERFTRHKKRIVRQGVALELLCLALNALDRHYNPPRRDTGIGVSHALDYRPIIPRAKTRA